MKKRTYKALSLSTNRDSLNRHVFFGKLKLPKDVDFLSICKDRHSHYYPPDLTISVLGNFSRPSKFIDYDFMIIENSDEVTVYVDLDEYQYINSVFSLDVHGSDIYWQCFDVFVRKS